MDNKVDYTKLWIVGMLCLTFMIVSGTFACLAEQTTALKAGYCEAQNIGTEGYHWVKCD